MAFAAHTRGILGKKASAAESPKT